MGNILINKNNKNSESNPPLYVFKDGQYQNDFVCNITPTNGYIQCGSLNIIDDRIKDKILVFEYSTSNRYQNHETDRLISVYQGTTTTWVEATNVIKFFTSFYNYSTKSTFSFTMNSTNNNVQIAAAPNNQLRLYNIYLVNKSENLPSIVISIDKDSDIIKNNQILSQYNLVGNGCSLINYETGKYETGYGNKDCKLIFKKDLTGKDNLFLDIDASIGNYTEFTVKIDDVEIVRVSNATQLIYDTYDISEYIGTKEISFNYYGGGGASPASISMHNVRVY